MSERLKRTPEPELMDERAQAEAYAEADFAEPHQHCVDTCMQLHGTLTGHVLDLGCGPGDVLSRYAVANPQAEFTGVDGAPVMLELARQTVDGRGVGARVRLEKHYLPSVTLAERHYDAVISNSLLHHLADPSALWKTIASTGRSGAPVFVMDLMRPDSADDVEALVAKYAVGAPDVLVRDFRASLHAAYRVEEVQQQIASAGLQLEVKMLSDRHLAAFGRLA